MSFDPKGYVLRAEDGFERFIEELGRPAQGPGLPAPAPPPDVPTMIEVSRRYGIETLGPPPA